MKELDAAESNFLSRGAARFAAERFGTVVSLTKGALGMTASMNAGGGLKRGALKLGATVLSRLAPNLVPAPDPRRPLPLPAPPIPASTPSAADREVVYFPSCVSRIFGALPGETGPSTMEATMRSLEAAGFRVRVPEHANSLCCGLAFSSKSQKEAGERALETTRAALKGATRDGALPVVTDASPCALHFAEIGGHGFRVLDFVQFWAREVLTRSDAPTGRIEGRAILHPTCSLTKLDAIGDLKAVAAAHARDPQVPLRAGCCGFAGNQGFVKPEITEGATRVEVEDVRALTTPDTTAYSTCRTCEIGMTRATGLSYASAAHLVYRALKLGER
jgi:D-lactate dehydrogenase